MEENPIFYPAYIEKQWRNRTLAYFHGESLVVEGGEIFPCHDLSELISCCFEQNLLTFVMPLAAFPWFDDLLLSGHSVFCSEHGKALAIRLKGTRNTSRWLINAANWGADLLSLEWLATMRAVFEYTHVGTHPSPGSLGQALFRQTMKEEHGTSWPLHRMRRPPGPAAEKIRGEISGARSETPMLNVQFDLAYEQDEHNAYGHALGYPQPCGKTFSISGKAAHRYTIFFVLCTVTIHQQLVLGPFPVRQGTGKNRHPVFPREPGTYTTWLWNAEIECCREEGISVEIIQGYGWKETTIAFQPFVERLATLRREATPEVRPYIKLALVAAIGRLGVPTTRYSLVTHNQRGPRDVALCDEGVAYDWWIHAEHDAYPQSMPHIFGHTLMICRLSLYERAKIYAEQEQLIATNTDAILVTVSSNLPKKGDAVQTGQWTEQELHHVVVKANRHLDSDEKQRHPGLPRLKKL